MAHAGRLCHSGLLMKGSCEAAINSRAAAPVASPMAAAACFPSSFLPSACGPGSVLGDARRSADPRPSRASGFSVSATADVVPPQSTKRVIKPFQKRTRICTVREGVDNDGKSLVGQTITIKGWVRTVRDQKTFAFIELNDGSAVKGLQAVVGDDAEGYNFIDDGLVSTGSSVIVTGEVVESKGKGQKVEIKASSIELVGTCEPETYPLQKKRHSMEFLRGIAHLRPRTNAIAATSRVRSALSYATHDFFSGNGFQYVHTPIVTASDCEGAGEQFLVTTALQGDGMIPPGVKDKFDLSRDFFGKPAYLTVSGQLNAEIYACALHDVYTFGPTFRAENSNTSRHLAEFWMIEPEMAFCDLEGDMACAEGYLKHCIRYILEHCAEDIAFFDSFISKGIKGRLEKIVSEPFATITYTEGVEILEKAIAEGKEFEYPIKWGADMQSEHERYLTEEVFKGTPLMVTDYPKAIKAFYMRENEDGRTVAAMDMLVPGVRH